MGVVIILTFVLGVISLFVYLSVKGKDKEKSRGLIQTWKYILLGSSALFVLLTFVSSIGIVPAGHIGVINFFGSVSKNELTAGPNIKNPLARLVKLSIRTIEIKDSLSVPSKEGLAIKLDVSILYHLDPLKAAQLYKEIGVDYESIIIHPYLRSITREVTSSYNAEALYTSGRQQLESEIYSKMSKVLGERGVFVEAIPLRGITLPSKLTSSIEEKLAMEQQAKQMEFVLLKEKKEAERKTIEAEGIHNFQQIVSQGISPQLLKWKGIEATLKLAESPNAKVVVIGSSDSGLPIILNSGKD
jgi:prohibitin 1